MECVNNSINSLLPENEGSLSFESDINKLRTLFDQNYKIWESLPPDNPHRESLVVENEKILNLILEYRC